MLLIVFLPILWISSRLVQSLPTSRQSALSNSLSTSKGPLAINKKPQKPHYKARLLPDNLDMKTLPLEDLVDMKPKFHASALDKDLYKHYFASHPQMQNVNLHESHPSEVAQALAALSNASKQGQPWKTKLTASIKDYLQDAPFHDETRRAVIQSSLSGLQYQSYSGSNRYKQRVEKKTKGEINEQRRKTEVEFKKQHGYAYGKRAKQLLRKNPFLNLPLSLHIGDDVTHLQAVESTKDLEDFYTSKKALTHKLKDYLRMRNFSDADYTVAMGLRTKHIELQKPYIHGKGAKGKKTLLEEPSQEISSNLPSK
jgi:hypothetical protein